jgi:hypothetical protein
MTGRRTPRLLVILGDGNDISSIARRPPSVAQRLDDAGNGLAAVQSAARDAARKRRERGAPGGDLV